MLSATKAYRVLELTIYLYTCRATFPTAINMSPPCLRLFLLAALNLVSSLATTHSLGNATMSLFKCVCWFSLFFYLASPIASRNHRFNLHSADRIFSGLGYKLDLQESLAVTKERYASVNSYVPVKKPTHPRKDEMDLNKVDVYIIRF